MECDLPLQVALSDQLTAPSSEPESFTPSGSGAPIWRAMATKGSAGK